MLFFIALVMKSTEGKQESDVFMQIFHCSAYNSLREGGGRRGRKLVLTSEDLFLFHELCDGNHSYLLLKK